MSPEAQGDRKPRQRPNRKRGRKDPVAAAMAARISGAAGGLGIVDGVRADDQTKRNEAAAAARAEADRVRRMSFAEQEAHYAELYSHLW
ncbi:hypothetical protein FWD20_00485 [Candidatus Saccharibacteria bacterium]|nr:hypothetical protein [Candidatus Saccharibacteria bacterium]